MCLADVYVVAKNTQVHCRSVCNVSETIPRIYPCAPLQSTLSHGGATHRPQHFLAHRRAGCRRLAGSELLDAAEFPPDRQLDAQSLDGMPGPWTRSDQLADQKPSAFGDYARLGEELHVANVAGECVIVPARIICEHSSLIRLPMSFSVDIDRQNCKVS